MSATDQRIAELETEGIIRFLYSTRPDRTRFYVFLTMTEHGTTQERKIPQSQIGKVLSEVESAARIHGHRFDPDKTAAGLPRDIGPVHQDFPELRGELGSPSD
jgi:hypothetical protein